MEKLKEDIARFCHDHGMADSEFGRLALNDKPFVSQIKKGRRVWPETEAKVRAFMQGFA